MAVSGKMIVGGKALEGRGAAVLPVEADCTDTDTLRAILSRDLIAN